MKKLLSLLLLLALLSGCTTAAPAQTETTTAPTEAPSVAVTETTAPPEATEETEAADFSWKEEALVVHYIDIGQADCMLLECDGETMLIDGGYADRAGEVVDYLEEQGVEKLDLVVGTHPHGDHIGATPTVMDAFPTDQVWSGPITYTNETVLNFRNAVAAQGLTIHYPQPGETCQLGDALVTVLGPVKSYYEDVNDLSLVLMVEYGETRFLFTGDMEMLAEDDMLDYWGDDSIFQADVLKVGHHGSYSSTGYRLLRAVMPTYGVICVGGNNEYGHPHDEPMSRLKDAEVTIYRTDKMYDIVAVSDGYDITFTWENQYAQPWTPEAA